jgi:hypothetical protein
MVLACGGQIRTSELLSLQECLKPSNSSGSPIANSVATAENHGNSPPSITEIPHPAPVS